MAYRKSETTHFHVNDRIAFNCHWQRTRSGFKHEGCIVVDGRITEGKVCYLNRTWERFTYETLLHVLVRKAKLSPADKAEVTRWIDTYKEPNPFGGIVAAAKTLALLAPNQTEANAAKVRMLKAGLGEAVSFPADWDSLPEDEKQRRLDGALGGLGSPLREGV